MEETKRCIKCGEEKSLEYFRLTPAGNPLACCTVCHNINGRKYYAKHRERVLARVKARYRKTRETVQAYDRQRYREHREKWLARARVSIAVRKGDLTRGPCDKCGTTINIEGHHDDYSKPLEVRWLCSSHHKRFHAELRRRCKKGT